MKFYYLKFNSKEQAEEILFDINKIPNDPASIVIRRFKWADWGDFNILETLYNYDENGQQIEIPGYHVNVISQIEIPELDPYNLTPTTPRQIWGM